MSRDRDIKHVMTLSWLLPGRRHRIVLGKCPGIFRGKCPGPHAGLGLQVSTCSDCDLCYRGSHTHTRTHTKTDNFRPGILLAQPCFDASGDKNNFSVTLSPSVNPRLRLKNSWTNRRPLRPVLCRQFTGNLPDVTQETPDSHRQATTLSRHLNSFSSMFTLDCLQSCAIRWSARYIIIVCRLLVQKSAYMLATDIHLQSVTQSFHIQGGPKKVDHFQKGITPVYDLSLIHIWRCRRRG